MTPSALVTKYSVLFMPPQMCSCLLARLLPRLWIPGPLFKHWNNPHIQAWPGVVQEDIHVYIASGCHERLFQGRLSCEPSSWGCPPRRPRRGGRGRLDGVPEQSCCLPSSTGVEVRYGFLTSNIILQSLDISACPSHYSYTSFYSLKCYHAWKLGRLDNCNM